ncbi:MAG: DinB family protein [Thermomicrobia bacterium]|nr:DinB family protein [Thermomicrobia bacterium]
MALIVCERVEQLRVDATAKAEETAQFLAGLTSAQATVMTEIGWTVTVTAAHLAFTSGFAPTQLKRMKRGRPIIPPDIAVATMNFFASRKNRAVPIARSAAKIRANTAISMTLIEDWTDAELDTRFKKPLFGATIYEAGLRYAFVGHLDEHLSQMRRALKV